MKEITKWMNPDLIFTGLEFKTREALLSFMSRQMEGSGVVKSSFESAVLCRENIYPTGLQTRDFGIAIPHTDAHHVNTNSLALCTLSSPVTFKQMGNSNAEIDVMIVFMLGIRESDSQINVLRELTEILQSPLLLQKLKEATTGKEVLQILAEDSPDMN